jgi:hypothetical protein
MSANVYSATTPPSNGALWEVDLKAFDKLGFPKGVKLRKILDLPSAQLLNGLTVLNRKKRTLLSADSRLGVVYKVDSKRELLKRRSTTQP